MAKRSKPTPISPFPDHIDRNYFSALVSGFTAGEGFFILYWHVTSNTGSARFGINLRSDDRHILELIRSFFFCGIIKDRPTRNGINGQSCLQVATLHDLWDIIVPHFDKNPMYAKKDRDFKIWKDAVEFLVQRRGKNHQLTWSQHDRTIFQQFMADIREQRKYDSSFEYIRPITTSTSNGKSQGLLFQDD